MPPPTFKKNLVEVLAASNRTSSTVEVAGQVQFTSFLEVLIYLEVCVCATHK